MLFTMLIKKRKIPLNLTIQEKRFDNRLTAGNQGEWYSFGISFFPAGEGSCLVLETASLDHRDIPMGFVRVLVNGISL